MEEKQFIKSYRRAKVAELCVITAIIIIFLIVLLSRPAFVSKIFSDPTLITLCALAWLSAVGSLICLVYDFFMLKSFALETHELNKEAYIDELTGMPNRHGLDAVIKSYETAEGIASAGCYMATIDNLNEVNLAKGRMIGDKLIQGFGSIFEKTGDKYGIAGRNGGNDFVLIMEDATMDKMNQFIAELKKNFVTYNAEHDFPIHVMDAYSINSEEEAETINELVTITYKKLHK